MSAVATGYTELANTCSTNLVYLKMAVRATIDSVHTVLLGNAVEDTLCARVGATVHYQCMIAPIMSPAFRFDTLTKCFNKAKLDDSWTHRGATITEAIWHLKWKGKPDEKKVGAPYVRSLLRLFIHRMPVMSFEEIHLEYKSKNHLVGGSIDMGVGLAANGNKPVVHIDGESKNLELYFGSLGEAKAATVKLGTCKTATVKLGTCKAATVKLGTCKTKTFEEEEEDTKMIIQPALEVMAVSQVATFPDENVPLVNIMATKRDIRPIFYWPTYDVLITTAKAVPLRLNQSQIDMRGLVLLFTTFQVHRPSCIVFDEAQLESKPKSGWAAALVKSKHSYHLSRLSLGVAPTGTVDTGSEFFTVPSDISSDSFASDISSDSSGDETPKPKRPKPHAE
jgi:hypothetical protein